MAGDNSLIAEEKWEEKSVLGFYIIPLYVHWQFRNTCKRPIGLPV